jgi:glycosyltransferase involved in cell wall biosynthesis
VSTAAAAKPVSYYLQKGQALLSQGRTQDTLQWIRQFLHDEPFSASAWSDAGVLCFAMNQEKEALRHFQRAVQLPECPKDAWLYLAHAATAAGQPESAVELMERLAGEGILDETLVQRMAGQFIQRQDYAAAAETLRRAERVLPQSGILDTLSNQIKTKRAKIAFFCGADGPTFLKPIIDALSRLFPVQIFQGTNTQQMAELMRWSDISWFEWATNLAQLGSTLPKMCRTIVRLHRYEAYSDYMKQIRWENIDLLVTVGNSFVIEALKHWVPDIRSRVRIASIPNGVDIEKIKFVPRKAGKKLAFIASARLVKNPAMMLQCIARLVQLDSDYKLHIAGDSTELLAEQYLKYQIKELGLSNSVFFDGWQKDIPGWLADKHYLLVTSFIESQGMGCLEAMASGLRPMIHNFPGAKEIYDSKYLFNTPDEFTRSILSGQYDSAEYRDFVERRYSLSRQLLKINEVITAMESNPAQC